MCGRRIHLKDEMKRATHSSTETASSGDGRHRERCMNWEWTSVSQRQNMTSIPAHTHTRHRSVCRQQGCDECIKGAPSLASSQTHVKLTTADNCLGPCLVRQYFSAAAGLLYNLQRSAKLAKNSSTGRFDERLHNSASRKAFLSCLLLSSSLRPGAGGTC